MDLKKMREDITDLIDDIKYKSDDLTDLDRLPIIQLNVILAKINTLTKKTTILLHYVEKQGEDQKKIKFSQKKEELVVEKPVSEEPLIPPTEIEALVPEPEVEKTETDDLETRLKQIAVKDLSTAIGINEKYLFASELFNGKINVFTEAINGLNCLESLDQAVSYLNDLATEHQWDLENETVVTFRGIVEGRYNQP